MVHEVRAADAQVQHINLPEDGVVEGVQEPGRVGDLAVRKQGFRTCSETSKYQAASGMEQSRELQKEVPRTTKALPGTLHPEPPLLGPGRWGGQGPRSCPAGSHIQHLPDLTARLPAQGRPQTSSCRSCRRTCPKTHLFS